MSGAGLALVLYALSEGPRPVWVGHRGRPQARQRQEWWRWTQVSPHFPRPLGSSWRHGLWASGINGWGRVGCWPLAPVGWPWPAPCSFWWISTPACGGFTPSCFFAVCSSPAPSSRCRQPVLPPSPPPILAGPHHCSPPSARLEPQSEWRCWPQYSVHVPVPGRSGIGRVGDTVGPDLGLPRRVSGLGHHRHARHALRPFHPRRRRRHHHETSHRINPRARTRALGRRAIRQTIRAGPNFGTKCSRRKTLSPVTSLATSWAGRLRARSPVQDAVGEHHHSIGAGRLR